MAITTLTNVGLEIPEPENQFASLVCEVKNYLDNHPYSPNEEINLRATVERCGGEILLPLARALIDNNPTAESIRFFATTAENIVQKYGDHGEVIFYAITNPNIYMNADRDIRNSIETLLAKASILLRESASCGESFVDDLIYVITQIDNDPLLKVTDRKMLYYAVLAQTKTASALNFIKMQRQAGALTAIDEGLLLNPDTCATYIYGIQEYYYKPESAQKCKHSDAIELAGFEYAVQLVTNIEAYLAGKTELFEESALPCIKLMLFEYLLMHPDSGITNIEQTPVYRKTIMLSRIEKHYKDHYKHLPTIGIELEIPAESMSPEAIAILSTLGIANKPESAAPQPLWEVAPKFSYSPHAQARILQKLYQLKLVPLKKNGSINNTSPLSLHINLSPCDDMSYAKALDKEPMLFDLCDGLTYGFASSRRISHRKTLTSFTITSADVERSEKASKYNNQLFVFRLELRTGEFRDAGVFPLLFDAQWLSAGAFANMRKAMPGMKLDEQEKALAKYASGFNNNITCMRNELGILPKAYDEGEHKRQAVVDLMEMSDVKNRCRGLCDYYATQMRNLIETEK